MGLLGGQVDLTAQGAGPLKGYSDDGKLRVLATFGAERHAAFPDAPSFVELGYKDAVFYVWAGTFVPKGVPTPVVARLRQAVNVVMNDPETIGILTKAGSPPAYMDAPNLPHTSSRTESGSPPWFMGSARSNSRGRGNDPKRASSITACEEVGLDAGRGAGVPNRRHVCADAECSCRSVRMKEKGT